MKKQAREIEEKEALENGKKKRKRRKTSSKK